jgi:threonyl-tRNA synthetase
MKILALHVDYIAFKPLKKALKSIGELSEGEKGLKRVEEALAVLMSVEKTDSSVSEISDKFCDAVDDIAKQVNAKRIVIYPYAHLSKNLGSPETAVEVMNNAERKLRDKYEVIKAPFGYYKEFELKVKGHPLSELSREIVCEGGESGKFEESYDYKKLLREISKSKLDTSKLKQNDHRILGREMDLFSFHDVAPGMIFWHNNGLIIRNELINFWREIHKKEGYKEILTPQVLDKRLWQISGHWEKYKENIFLTDYEKRDFAVKPMNCPGGILVFKSSPKSYKDFPLRVGELGLVHRMELSGTLGGLFRVIQFTQDDAHIYCTEKQMADELEKVVNLANYFYKKFGLNLSHIELSTRPKKRIGDDKIWDKSEKVLDDVLKKSKIKYKINEGDGAFYGPKIDFHLKDSLGRTWQCGTVQLDFAMPERFELEYNDKDNKKKKPVMIHRTIYGSIERFLGILLENTNGRLPTWLAPVQVRMINFTDRNTGHSKKIMEEIRSRIPELRIDSDFESTTVQSKVKDAELMRVPYIIVIGDREEKENNLAVRIRGGKNIEKMSVEGFIEKIKKELEERS